MGTRLEGSLYRARFERRLNVAVGHLVPVHSPIERVVLDVSLGRQTGTESLGRLLRQQLRMNTQVIFY